jgi:ribosomal protein L22
MSPEREIDETKGGKPDEKIVEQAAEAKAEQEAKTPRRRRRRKAEDTEVAAAAEEQAKPRRRRRRKAEDDEAAEAEPKAEASGVGRQASEEHAEEPEEPEAKDGDDEATDEDGPTPETRRPTPDAEDGPTPEARPTPNAQRPTPPLSVRAHARYVRTSARKARLVCDHIRGKSVPEARAILGFTPRAAARDWSKVLESAVANAEANHELIGDELKVAEAYADEGPTLKRYRPRAMGRATRIRKRTSHLTITLAPAANESKERSR